MTKLPSKPGGGGGPAWLKKLEQATGGSLQAPNAATAIARAGGAVVLAVDCSISMTGEKLNHARSGSLAFAADALSRGFAVGVLQFGSVAEELAPPGRSEPELRAALEKLHVTGSTNMAAGIDRAVTLLGGKSGVICIVTDGMPDSPPETLAAVARAREAGIEIMAVGTDDADWNFLSKIVGRKELAAKVERAQLGRQIGDMAKLLPKLPPPRKS